MDPWRSFTLDSGLAGGWRVGPLHTQTFPQSLLRREPTTDLSEGWGMWTAVGAPLGRGRLS